MLSRNTNLHVYYYKINTITAMVQSNRGNHFPTMSAALVRYSISGNFLGVPAVTVPV